MTDIELRLAGYQDAARIASMSRRLVERGLAPSWPRARVEWHLRHSESLVLTARARGDLAGFGIMQFGEESAHLNLLAVDPRHRRRAVGRALVAWLEATAAVAGTFVIRLETRAGSRGAQGFYEALGYRQTGRVSGYYQGVEDAIQMARDLRTESGARREPRR
jgi:ribosomal-protein-alanine N-acetyltransferase